MSITILIPILNEAAELQRRIEGLSILRDHPSVAAIVFTDSGSTDEGPQLVRQAGYELQSKIFCGPSSIGKALSQSDHLARTSRILILPIDVHLSEAHLDELSAAIDRFPKQAFVFRKKYDSHSLALRLGELILSLFRERLLKNFVWTNVFCLLQEDLRLVPQVGFLEDVLLSDHIKKTRTFMRLDTPVIVSARKYIGDGPWLRLLMNMTILALFRIGICKPQMLKKLYQLSRRQQKQGDSYEKIENIGRSFGADGLKSSICIGKPATDR